MEFVRRGADGVRTRARSGPRGPPARTPGALAHRRMRASGAVPQESAPCIRAHASESRENGDSGARAVGPWYVTVSARVESAACKAVMSEYPITALGRRAAAA